MKFIVKAFSIVVVLMVLINTILAQDQKPNCGELFREDPKAANNVYWPHDTNCNLYYQCSAHGLVRMKCQYGMHFDRYMHQCGRPDEVEC
ncbi:unnamed protein product [Diamesa serratosioi]